MAVKILGMHGSRGVPHELDHSQSATSALVECSADPLIFSFGVYMIPMETGRKQIHNKWICPGKSTWAWNDLVDESSYDGPIGNEDLTVSKVLMQF